MLGSRTWEDRRGIGHVACDGSDARIGKTKMKRNAVSKRKVPLYRNIFYFTVYSCMRIQRKSKHVGSLLVVLCNGL